MRILAISHSCVMDVNQQLFVSLRQLHDVAIELVIPRTWRSGYSARPFAPKLLPTVDFRIHQLPVAMSGHVSLHFYPWLPLRRLRQFRPDVLLSEQEPWSLSGFQAASLAKWLGVPFVFRTNQNILKQYPLPFSWVEQLSYRYAAAALAYSEEARQVMIRKGLRTRSMVLPYAVDLSLFHKTDNASLRSQLGLSNSLVLGYMGRLVPEKGLDTLVEAVRQITEANPDLNAKVLIIGSGPDEGRLRQMISTGGLCDRFVFTGPVPHGRACEFMNCLDLFVLPSRTTRSWKEQFGRVIIEAMASSVPVVGSNSGYIPHLIADTGGGLVFQEGSPVDLAEKLLVLLNDADERTRLGKVGAEAVRRRYTHAAVADQLHPLLLDVQAGTHEIIVPPTAEQNSVIQE